MAVIDRLCSHFVVWLQVHVCLMYDVSLAFDPFPHDHWRTPFAYLETCLAERYVDKRQDQVEAFPLFVRSLINARTLLHFRTAAVPTSYSARLHLRAGVLSTRPSLATSHVRLIMPRTVSAWLLL